MNPKIEDYGRIAATWALDDQAALRGTARHAQLMAGGLLAVAVMEAFALLMLTPLKTSSVVPVLVDRQTGFVEVLKSDGRAEIRADGALTQSLLAQYVIARESFNISDVTSDYRKVALWSAGPARQEYLASMPAGNAKSPLHRYPRSTLVETRIKSISPLGRHTALVRFDTVWREEDGHARSPKAWAAVVDYRYSDKPLAFEDRLFNPLGFQVVGYHKDPEALDPSDPPPAPPPTPSVATTPLAVAVTSAVPPPPPLPPAGAPLLPDARVPAAALVRPTSR
jgi:type IV secretion system protein VirB8